MSFDDLDPWVQGSHCLCSPATCCTSHVCLRFFFFCCCCSALKLCEMSCVVLRLRVEECLRHSCAEPVAVSYQSMFSRGCCGHCGFVIAGPPCSSAKTSAMQVSSGAFLRIQHKGWSNGFFPFCLARLIDRTSLTHLVGAHKTFLYPFAFGCR